MEKRYYWLKFRDDFFDSKRIKKLRKMAGGDTYVVIYLKMQLKALKTDGVLKYTGIEPDFVDELALDLDESPDDVRLVLSYLLSYGLCECSDNIHYFLPYVVENTGSETANAQRVRDYRERRKALHCNKDVMQLSQPCNVEIEKEKDTRDRDKSKSIDSADKPHRFTPPTVDEVRDYCRERGNTVDAGRFVDYYTANGWKVGKNPMKDWKAAVRTWERSAKPEEDRYANLRKLMEETPDD